MSRKLIVRDPTSGRYTNEGANLAKIYESGRRVLEGVNSTRSVFLAAGKETRTITTEVDVPEEKLGDIVVEEREVAPAVVSVIDINYKVSVGEQLFYKLGNSPVEVVAIVVDSNVDEPFLIAAGDRAGTRTSWLHSWESLRRDFLRVIPGKTKRCAVLRTVDPNHPDNGKIIAEEA